MADSPVTEASGLTPDAAASVDSSSNDADAGDTGEQAPDYSAQRAAVERAQREAALEAELEASRRARGHISNHASRLDAAEKRLETLSGELVSVSNWNTLLDAVADLLPQGVAASLRVDTGARVSGARIEALEGEIEKLKSPTRTEPETEHPEITRLRTGWESAYSQVDGYARGRGLNAAEMPTEADWKAAFDANPGDPAGGMERVMKLVDDRAAARARRADRADAASGGPKDTAPRKGGLTRDMMKKMSAKELMAYTREERNAALMAP